MKKFHIILLLFMLACSGQSGDKIHPPSSLNEFKEVVRNIVRNSNKAALCNLLYNNEIPLTEKEKEAALLFFDKSKPIEISIVKYFPNSIAPIETPKGYSVFSIQPDYYCLIEQQSGEPPNQGVISLELGLCDTERGIYICGRKYIERWQPSETNTKFILIAPNGLRSQFKATNGNWNWGTRLNGFDCRNFTLNDFAKFLEDRLNVEIKNKTDILGAYTFYAPIGKEKSISRSIVGVEKIGLKLVED